MRSIVIPIDGSGRSHAALPYAVRLAQLYGAELLLSGMGAASSDHLEQVRASLVGMGVTARLGHEGELVVVSAPLREAISAECPVLVVKPGEHKPGEGHFQPFRRIVLPLDGSPLAEGALPVAASLAGRDRSQLCLLRVVEYSTWLCCQGRTGVEEYLSRQVDKLRQQGLSVYCEACVGDPAQKILEAAEPGADLIVMATHGHSGVTRQMLGSVADRVVSEARCPVLLVQSQPSATLQASW